MKNNIVVHTGNAGRELFDNSLKELYEKPSAYSGVWIDRNLACPQGEVCDPIYANTTPRVVSEKEMLDRVKSSFYNSRRDKEKLKKYFKNIDHSEENRIYVDNMFKTILDKDLFKILLEDYLTKKNLISKAYKKIDTRRIGPGLMEFLEDGNVYSYSPQFNFGVIVKDVKQIWYGSPTI